MACTPRLPGKDTYEYVDRAAEEHDARIMAATGLNTTVAFFDATDGTVLSALSYLRLVRGGLDPAF